MKIFLSVLLVIAVPSGLFSHAHIFVEQQLVLEMAGEAVKGLRIDWTFDDMTSSLVAQDYPADRNGRFRPLDEKDLRDSFVDGLAPQDFYIRLKWNRAPLQIPFPSEFTAYLRNGKLVYNFLLPLNRRPRPGDVLEAAIYDETFFTDLFYRKDQPLKVAPPGAPVKFQLMPGAVALPYGGRASTAVFQF